MTTLISIIMPCYNRVHDLRRILEAYDQQVGSDPFEIIAIDDASTDTTYEMLDSYRPSRYSMRIEHQSQNQGPAAARNRGIALATSPLIMFVGDDILPAPDFVLSHLSAHCYHAKPEIAILGRVTWPPDIGCNTLMSHIDGVGAQQFSYNYFQNGQEYDFRHFYTANISVKSSLLQQDRDLFDTNFPYAAFEDAEFAYRLAKHGLRIIYDERPTAFHYHYHTIWTFSTRQYRAGLMACLLAKKHPELAGFLRVTKTKYLFGLGLIQQFNQDALSLAESATWLEELALHITSFYEWSSHPMLDDLYIKILEYFWRKGLIDGVFKASSSQAIVRNTYTLYYLGDFLKHFLAKADSEKIPIPMKDYHDFYLRLAAAENSIAKQLLNWWQKTGYRLVKSKLYPEKIPS